MAGLRAVLGALGRAVWRDLRSLRSIAGNNLFLFVALIAIEPSGAAFFGAIFGFLLLFPVSADPMTRIPRERLPLWPLTPGQLRTLRAASLALSPVTWIALAVLTKMGGWRAAAGFVLLTAVIRGLAAVAHRFHLDSPRLGASWLDTGGGLLVKESRQLLQTLDPYAGFVLAFSGTCYRLFAKSPEPEAFPILSLLVALSLSTYGQSLFGLDGVPGMVRYRLLPLRGWQILLIKGVPVILAVTFLTLAMAPLPAVTGILSALAAGNYTSIRKPRAQHRWRFTGGEIVPAGAAQVFLLFASGLAAHRASPLFGLGALAAYGISILICGRMWDRPADDPAGN